MKKEEMHKALNSLVGILTGIVADGVINEAESSELKNWYALHEKLIGLRPFNEILPIIRLAFADNILDIEEAENVLWLCRKFLCTHQEDMYFGYITSELQQLEGMLHGIIADGVISDGELSDLNEWLNNNDHLSGAYPFDEIYSLLLAAKDDGVVSEDERNMLKAFFATFVDTRVSYNIHEREVEEMQKHYTIGGICAICPDIHFKGKNFCFTGVSKRAKRAEIADIIADKGGVYSDRVSKDTDYLIVGGDGNPCWAFSCYGRKVEQAMNMRKAGRHIVIVHENDFWDEI